MTTHQISLPAIFAADHCSRELPSGDLVKENKRFLTFDCTEDQLQDWLSDAYFYSNIEWMSGDTGQFSSLQQSARSTFSRIRKVLSDIEELRELQEQFFQQAHQAQEEAP